MHSKWKARCGDHLSFSIALLATFVPDAAVRCQESLPPDVLHALGALRPGTPGLHAYGGAVRAVRRAPVGGSQHATEKCDVCSLVLVNVFRCTNCVCATDDVFSESVHSASLHLGSGSSLRVFASRQ